MVNLFLTALRFDSSLGTFSGLNKKTESASEHRQSGPFDVVGRCKCVLHFSLFSLNECVGEKKQNRTKARDRFVVTCECFTPCNGAVQSAETKKQNKTEEKRIHQQKGRGEWFLPTPPLPLSVLAHSLVYTPLTPKNSHTPNSKDLFGPATYTR